MIIVSLTSVSYRIEGIEPVLSSICNGEMRPDRLFLWVSNEPSLKDEGITTLPAFLQRYPVEVRVTTNIGPSTKLLPAVKEFWEKKDTIIVTADDDIVYPHYWLDRLVRAFSRYPDRCLCYRARLVRHNRYGAPLSYNRYPILRGMDNVREFDLLVPNGTHGVLYKVGFFSEGILDIDNLMRCSITNDDLWISAHLIKNKVKVHVLESQSSDFRDVFQQGHTLWSSNISENDKIIRRLAVFGKEPPHKTWRSFLLYAYQQITMRLSRRYSC
ncbi:MAG: hypothetical protein HY537_01130 [Deltaproteobacteria bacterium]|nr:hypothetical protein [Deltaproteobacteria bacterium]